MLKTDYPKIMAEVKKIYSYDKKAIQKIADKYKISYQLAEWYWNCRYE